MLSKRPHRVINNMGEKNYFMINNIKNKQHPCEKPIELMKKLIENSTNKGEVVLDPFMGTGATIIASIQSNRKYIGIEIDEHYYNIVQDRIKQANGNVGLFEV